MIYLIIAARTISIMLLFLFMTLITGRRKIGEMPVFDFLVFIALGSVVGADIVSPEIDHLHIAFALVLIVGMQYLYSGLIIKNRKIGKLLTFEPVVVIENGQIVKSSLKRIRYSIDNILTMLREKEVFELSEVEFAIIESTGKLSVLKKSQYSAVTPRDLNISTEYKGLSISLIIDGQINFENLKHLGLDKAWLLARLKNQNISSEKEVFYAELNTQGNLYVSKGLNGIKNANKINH